MRDEADHDKEYDKEDVEKFENDSRLKDVDDWGDDDDNSSSGKKSSAGKGSSRSKSSSKEDWWASSAK